MIFAKDVKDTFEDELADAVIRIADLCGYLNIDLESHIKAKMRYNETRPHKHGKEY
jgi:NTP pyrophosphatase (non-canonical NTP hydrolase)